MRKAFIVACLALGIGCQSQPPRPQEIEPSDMCGHCRMAISQKRFAAEVIDKEENAHKFDEIGCLLRYLEEGDHKYGAAAIFVADYETKRWIEASRAHYVKTQAIHTPMGGGVVAFSDEVRAEPLARQNDTGVLRFEQLIAP